MRKSERLAFAAVGAAVSLTGVVLAYYVSVMSLTFNLLAVLGIVMPLLKKYYREAALAAFAVILIGFFWVNVKIVAFAFIGSFYTVVTIYCFDKGFNRFILLAIKFLYSLLAFFLLYKIFAFIALDLSTLKLDKLSPTVLYVILNAIFSIAFLIYDTILLQGVKYLRNRFKNLLNK